MKRSDLRLRFLYFIFLSIVLIVIGNVFFVTIGKKHLRSGTSLDDYIYSVSNVEEKIFASRGNIYEAGVHKVPSPLNVLPWFRKVK